MKQITIVLQNNAISVSGINNRDEIIEPTLTESLTQHIQSINDELDAIKDPIDKVADFIKENATDEQLVGFYFLFPPWQVEREYIVGDLFTYDGVLYRVIQPIKAMEHQPPNIVPAHYTAITIEETQPDAIVEWFEPTSTHFYTSGQLVRFTDGQVYESIFEGNNIWSPTDYPAGWKLRPDLN